MDLLCALAAEPGRVFAREELLATVWAGSVVGDDALARAVFKLRTALGDDSRAPRYIETIAKRGYRLRAEVSAEVSAVGEKPAAAPPLDSKSASRQPTSASGTGLRGHMRFGLVVGVLALMGLGLSLGLRWATWPVSGSHAPPDAALEPLRVRAETFYFRFKRGDNEAAIELYQRVLDLQPDDVPALAGLANALAQRVIRWPAQVNAPAGGFTRLGEALAHGHLQQPPAREVLLRARALAERAVSLQAESASAHKALGFVLSAQGDFDTARASYLNALALDPDHWSAEINIADTLDIEGRAAEALPSFDRAFASMERVYLRSPEQVQLWQPRLAQLIAERHLAAGRRIEAEAWFRRALAVAPTDPQATRGLAALLVKGGDSAAAARLCGSLDRRLGQSGSCDLRP
jgi:DNA-binding winged helix-turn-helix (wHTH) protein/Flp pilus assembly protein TadD